jgi:hypothetical protein
MVGHKLVPGTEDVLWGRRGRRGGRRGGGGELWSTEVRFLCVMPSNKANHETVLLNEN